MKNKKILIIDDELEMAQLLKIELETEGYSVMMAHDGVSGLELIKNEKPHLVLLDIMMPGLDGYEVLRQLRADALIKDVTVLLLTAKGLDEEIKKGLDLGADDYILKPFHAGLLIKKIERILKKKIT
jgi:DNA-binding response OmpR family regulator